MKFTPGQEFNEVQYMPAAPDFVFDTIPFYENGVLHVFYLSQNGSWSHVSTTDMISYEKWPDALVSGGLNAPDRECWTGSVYKKDETYYLYYTGKNIDDPNGDQKVMMATSTDLKAWMKQAENTFYADGAIYWNKTINGNPDMSLYENQELAGDEAFRDPNVFYDPVDHVYRMLLHARRASNQRHCFGMYTSTDLIHWIPQAPLEVEKQDMDTQNMDCPNMFELDGKWYLVFSDARWLVSDKPNGVFKGEALFMGWDWAVPQVVQDKDGRLLTVGTIRASSGLADSGSRVGAVSDSCLSMVREIYVTSDGRLQTKPISEVVEHYSKTVYSNDGKTLCLNDTWEIDTPDNYMLDMKVLFEASSKLEFYFRQQSEADSGGYSGYLLAIGTDSNDVVLQCPEWSTSMWGWNRGVTIDYRNPVDIKLFVNGDIAELFVEDQVALEARLYDHRSGIALLKETLGNVQIINLFVKVSD